MTIIELRPQRILRIKQKNPNSLSAELVFLPIALVAALAGLLLLTIDKNLRELGRAFDWRL